MENSSATNAVVLTEAQESSRQKFIAAAKRYYAEQVATLKVGKNKAVREDTQTRWTKTGALVKHLEETTDFAGLFDKNTGQPVTPPGGEARTLESFLQEQKARFAEVVERLKLKPVFNGKAEALGPMRPLRSASELSGLRPVSQQAKESQPWVGRLAARAERKLQNGAVGFMRQSVVAIGLLVSIEGLAKSLVPRKEEVIKDGEVTQDGSASRKRGLISLAAGLGIAGAAALI